MEGKGGREEGRGRRKEKEKSAFWDTLVKAPWVGSKSRVGTGKGEQPFFFGSEATIGLLFSWSALGAGLMGVCSMDIGWEGRKMSINDV